jgi:hypothetical protein
MRKYDFYLFSKFLRNIWYVNTLHSFILVKLFLSRPRAGIYGGGNEPEVTQERGAVQRSNDGLEVAAEDDFGQAFTRAMYSLGFTESLARG